MANLSNINGKFLFTDGDFLLIGGATANSISATESGVAIKNSNAATLSLQNSATNGKNHTLWSNTDGSFNITDVGVATRFTIASGGDVYFPETLRLGIGTNSIYPQGGDTILKLYSASGGSSLYLQNASTGSATTDGSKIWINNTDLTITNMEGETRFFNEGFIMMNISKFDGSANSNPLTSSNIRIWTHSKTGWLSGDILSKIEFYSNDVSGIGARNAASIRVVNEDGNGSTTTTFSGALAFYTSAYNSTEQEAVRIDSSGNVGIGTASPGTKLEVKGSGNTAINSKGNLFVSSGGTAAQAAETGGQISFGSWLNGDLSQPYPLAAIRGVAESSTTNVNKGALIFGTMDSNTAVQERMRIDSSGNSTFAGNVSITKASTPELILTDTTNNVNLLIAVDDANTFLRSSSGAPILFQTNAGTTALTLDASQNATFAKNISVTDGTLTLNKSDGSLVKFVYNNTTRGYIGSSRQLFVGGLEADMGYLAIGDSVFGAGGVERMRITSGGKVIVGTNSSNALEVFSSGDTEIGFSYATKGNVYAKIIGDITTASPLGGEIAFQTATGGTLTERMRITSGGSVLIDTTDDTPNSVTTSAYLVSVNDGVKWAAHFAATSTSSRDVVAFSNPNGKIGAINTDGTTTSYETSSDYRLKENVVEMTGALDRVSQLKPSRFNFIADADKTVDGFLAHEVQEIVPEAISGEKDAVDEDGNPDYQGIDQSKLVPLLVGAIQELKAEIELLKTQINN